MFSCPFQIQALLILCGTPPFPGQRICLLELKSVLQQGLKDFVASFMQAGQFTQDPVTCDSGKKLAGF